MNDAQKRNQDTIARASLRFIRLQPSTSAAAWPSRPPTGHAWTIRPSVVPRGHPHESRQPGAHHQAGRSGGRAAAPAQLRMTAGKGGSPRVAAA